jgi:CheY-like chemotaxis protein
MTTWPARRTDTIVRTLAPSKRILVCDDDPVILRLLEVNLELEGYDVIAARHGAEAVDLATQNPPDLVILDIMMPRMDGYEACEAIKAQDATRDVPVIFLSAKAQQSDVEKGRRYGVAEYLTKPFDPSELLEIVERLTA